MSDQAVRHGGSPAVGAFARRGKDPFGLAIARAPRREWLSRAILLGACGRKWGCLDFAPAAVRHLLKLQVATLVGWTMKEFGAWKEAMNMKRWQDWANLALGVWMIISPWVLGFANVYNVAALSAWAFGAGIVVFAGMVAYMPKAWEEGINVLLGLGLVASPWVLDFSSQSDPTSNATVVGVLVAVLALWAMLGEQTIRDRLFRRQQTR